MPSEYELSDDIRLTRHIQLLHSRGVKEVRVLCVDFDGAITGENKYPNIGEFRRGAIAALKAFEQAGGKVLVWTCREGVWRDRALSLLKIDGFVPDWVNGETILRGSRKPFFDLLIDDRALGCVLDWYFIGKLLKEMAPKDKQWFKRLKGGFIN